ncbi:MAG: type I DNA topoisomerase [gamma proteobacterium symbiont of Ctena orbiculata]|nr:MAG: type I DNA topoisomerase [gamma proteobacterium symbiont of Ctena orbiculata]
MTHNLLIVESPNKCKKIQSILGDGWIVKASMGHVRDLPAKEMGVDLKTFQPTYVDNTKGQRVLAGLRKLSRTASKVWLATDPDREGEAIAWHLQQALRLKNPIRVSFNEITKQAIGAAIRQPGRIDTDLVRAQEGRRVLDRLVGYSVSPALSRACGNGAWLTAGRVQSVALRLVVDREREIRDFTPTDYLEVRLRFVTDGIDWQAQWRPGELLPAGQKHWTDRAFAERVASLREVAVASIQKTKRSRRPPPPFITSSLQQAASASLKRSPDLCMQDAQALFEAGLITYHRTDNPNLSDDGLREVVEWLHQNGYGEDVANQANRWKAKAGAQEGHEAIRPTSLEKAEVYDGVTSDQQKLYALIRERTLACQMKPAQFNVTSIMLASTEQLDGSRMWFEARGEVLVYPGWMKLSERDSAEEPANTEGSQQLPTLLEHQPLTALAGEVKDKQTKPPARYTEASLIRKLEAEGIGRPATYAAILKNIVQRDYVVIQKRKLAATDLGILIVRMLVERFRFLEVGYTREIQAQLDEIAAGRNRYLTVVSTAYRDLAEELKSLEGVVVEATTQHVCPECGKPLRLIQNTFWGCSGYPECSHTAPNEKGKPGKPRAKRKNGEVDQTYPCDCGKGYLQRRQTRQGDRFWGCSNYPTCKHTMPDDNGKPGKRQTKSSTSVNTPQAAGEVCPTCKSGTLVLRTIKNGKNAGKTFYGCTQFPECNHFSWAKT